MSKRIQNQFLPDHVSPPGETLLETLEAIGMIQAELAKRTGRPKKLINEIIKGKAAITPETAIQLERVLNIPAGFWNNREQDYREALARLKEQDRLGNQTDWLKKFPINPMIKKGWIKAFSDKVQQLRELLGFMGVAAPDQLQILLSGEVAFRKSTTFKSDPGAVIAWLRKGELDAQSIRCKSYDPKEFRKALQEIRLLTREDPEVFQPKMVRLCAESGVAIVFVPELPATRVNGATRWINPNKALIQLSLRYKTDDQLWFTFFHEAGHILYHGKRDVFLETGDSDEDDKEQEANNFAGNTLIPDAKLQKLIRQSFISKASVKRFASELGVAPGIVVGRLQHDKRLPYNHCNELKRRFDWAE